ncbi:MAG: hypothetical protein K2G70_07255 [Turicibacter sp.]|nr:hypothetical protein [Turicibacter sp.]
MPNLVINIIFNHLEEEANRKTLVLNYNSDFESMIISPKENKLEITILDKEICLFSIKHVDGYPKITKFIESIYTDTVKVFDFYDYDIHSYKMNGELQYRLEERNTIKIPPIF